MERCKLRYHVWHSPEFDTVEELAAADEGEGEGQDVMAATVTELPSSNLEGAWERLVALQNIAPPQPATDSSPSPSPTA